MEMYRYKNTYIMNEKFQRGKLPDKNLSETLFAEISAGPMVCHTKTFRNWKLLYIWHFNVNMTQKSSPVTILSKILKIIPNVFPPNVFSPKHSVDNITIVAS